MRSHRAACGIAPALGYESAQPRVDHAQRVGILRQQFQNGLAQPRFTGAGTLDERGALARRLFAGLEEDRLGALVALGIEHCSPPLRTGVGPRPVAQSPASLHGLPPVAASRQCAAACACPAPGSVASQRSYISTSATVA